jgi:hypothetical protein
VITAIIHISTTPTVYLHRSDEAVLADIRDQIHATLDPPPRGHSLHERTIDANEEALHRTRDDVVILGAGWRMCRRDPRRPRRVVGVWVPKTGSLSWRSAQRSAAAPHLVGLHGEPA